jgi:hypothetical protein
VFVLSYYVWYSNPGTSNNQSGTPFHHVMFSHDSDFLLFLLFFGGNKLMVVILACNLGRLYVNPSLGDPFQHNKQTNK